MAEASTALDAAYRALTWVGYGGLAGALVVLLAVWPDGVRQRRLALVALGGSTLIALAAFGWLTARLALGADPVVPRVEGTAAIVRVAVLAAIGGFFTDLLDGPVRGRRRSAVAVAVLALTATVLAGAAGGRPGPVAAQLTGDVLVAVASVVCGACVVLAAVVVPGDAGGDLPHLRSRVLRTAPVGLLCVALAGAVHAVTAVREPAPVHGPPADVLVPVLVTAALLAVLGLRWLVRRAPSPVAGAGDEPQAGTWPAPPDPPAVVVLPDTAAAQEAPDTAEVENRTTAPRRG